MNVHTNRAGLSHSHVPLWRKRTKSCDLSHDQPMHVTYHVTDKVPNKYCKNTVKSGKYMQSMTLHTGITGKSCKHLYLPRLAREFPTMGTKHTDPPQELAKGPSTENLFSFPTIVTRNQPTHLVMEQHMDSVTTRSKCNGCWCHQEGNNRCRKRNIQKRGKMFQLWKTRTSQLKLSYKSTKDCHGHI